jgi:hypothetical protein
VGAAEGGSLALGGTAGAAGDAALAPVVGSASPGSTAGALGAARYALLKRAGAL